MARSTRTVAALSRAIAMRGSAGAEAETGPAPRVGPGTAAAVPDVGSPDDAVADDSCCFDLSGDSPATDASSCGAHPQCAHPNREKP
ncbi:hypothetical protein ACFWFF_35760 [Streptomyces sp. NPDC060223]|uniref:hypothetical protein n=1 Tax=Streptomyces sp. NPDC060223 TaxID=3347077 RepID=UPI0036579B14